jgi:hypothetical protein
MKLWLRADRKEIQNSTSANGIKTLESTLYNLNWGGPDGATGNAS